MFLHAKEFQRLPANHQKLGEKPGTDSPFQLPEGTHSEDTCISDFWLPELWDNECLLFKPHRFWTSIRTVQTNRGVWGQPLFSSAFPDSSCRDMKTLRAAGVSLGYSSSERTSGNPLSTCRQTIRGTPSESNPSAEPFLLPSWESC